MLSIRNCQLSAVFFSLRLCKYNAVQNSNFLFFYRAWVDVCPKLCSSIILTFPLNVLLQGWIRGEKICTSFIIFFILQLSSKFCNTKAQFSHGSSPTHFLKSVCLICDERCTAHPRQKPFPDY